MARKKQSSYTTVNAVRDIMKGKIHRLYVLKGNEMYFHDLVVTAMKKWAQKEGLDVEIIYADEISSVPENTGGGGLFATGKLYIVKYWQVTKKKQMALWQRFFIDDPDLFYVVSIDPSSRGSFKIATIKDMVTVDCSPLKGRQLKAFVEAAIKKKGKTITDTALEMLVMLSGGKLTPIMRELEKIPLIEEDVIDENVVTTYFSLQAEGNVFIFWDSLWMGKTGDASEMKQALLLSGTSPTQLLATIATFLRGVLEVGQLRSKGLSVKEISSLTSKNAFYVGKLLRLYDIVGETGALKLLRKLYDVDKGIKTGELTDRDALDAILDYIISMRGSAV